MSVVKTARKVATFALSQFSLLHLLLVEGSKVSRVEG